MPLRPTRDRRVRLRNPAAAGVDDVDAREDAAAKVRMRRVDARVEERDRHSRAVETRDLQVGDRGGKDAAAVRLRGLRGVGDAHRVDPLDLAVMFEQGGRRRVETRREAVEHARVAVLGSDPRPDGREPREELLLQGDSRRGPGTISFSVARPPAARTRAARDGGLRRTT